MPCHPVANEFVRLVSCPLIKNLSPFLSWLITWYISKLAKTTTRTLHMIKKVL